MVRNGVRVLSTRMARRGRGCGLSGHAFSADRAFRGRGRSGRAGGSVSKRMAALPDVPTIAETLPGFEALNWFVLAAPAGTPAAVIDRLHTALRQVFERDGLDVVGSSRAQARAFIAHEIGKWTQIIEEKGLQIQ